MGAAKFAFRRYVSLFIARLQRFLALGRRKAADDVDNFLF
jgi:hypothetical protein